MRDVIRRIAQFEDLVRKEDRRTVAVVAPYDTNTLRAVQKAVRRESVRCILVGNRIKITKSCREAEINPSGCEIVHVDGADYYAATKAIELIQAGKAHALMKGLISTSDFLTAILKSNLYDKGSLLHQMGVFDIPHFDRLIFACDCAVNITVPTAKKIAMIKSAIEVMRLFGINSPKIAIISATEKLNPKIEATVNALEICSHIREEVTGSLDIEGPLSFDLALSEESVKIKGVPGEVPGRAELLILPNLEAANILMKAVPIYVHGKLASILLGTRIPVVLTSRADSGGSKYNSILAAIALHILRQRAAIYGE